MLCKRYSVLLDRHSVASTRYHQATSRLISLAGQSQPDRFAEAKQNCDACLNHCKQTAAAMRIHRANHRC